MDKYDKKINEKKLKKIKKEVLWKHIPCKGKRPTWNEIISFASKKFYH